MIARPMLRLRLTRSLALPLLVVLACACSKSAPPNVVIVVLDTARPDFVSAYGDPHLFDAPDGPPETTPFLEELAKEGTTYDRAYASSSWTLPSHATLFTGVLPAVHHATQGHPKLDEKVPTLAERLTAAGYATAGFSNNPWVSTTTDLSRGFATWIDKWEKRESRDDADPKAHPTVRAVDEWLATKAKSDQPFLLFVNLIEPHMPYLPPPECAAPFLAPGETVPMLADRYFKRGEPNALLVRHYSGEAPLTDDDWRALRKLYEGELRYVDSLAHAIVTAARAKGGSERTLVFVVSDHGENFGEHGHIGHTFNLYESNVRVVMLAAGPGIERAKRETKLAQLADVHATALAAADLPRDKHGVGQDLRKALPHDRLVHAALDRPVISFGALPEDVRAKEHVKRFDRELEAVIGPRFKLIRGSDGSEELYDVRDDPKELHPIVDASEASSFVGGARAVMEAVRASASGVSSPGAQGITSDPRMREALRSLGYAQ